MSAPRKLTLAEVFEGVLREVSFLETAAVAGGPDSPAEYVLQLEHRLMKAREAAVFGQRSQILHDVLRVAAGAVLCLMDHGMTERDYAPCLIESHRPGYLGIFEAESRLAADREKLAGVRLRSLLPVTDNSGNGG